MTYTHSLFPTFSGYQAAAHALLAEHPQLVQRFAPNEVIAFEEACQ